MLSEKEKLCGKGTFFLTPISLFHLLGYRVSKAAAQIAGGPSEVSGSPSSVYHLFCSTEKIYMSVPSLGENAAQSFCGTRLAQNATA